MNISDDIMNLIIRHLNQQTSDADDVRLQQWRKADAENEEEFLKIQKIWSASSFEPVKTDVDAEWNKFRQRHFTDTKRLSITSNVWVKVISLAAAASLIIGLFYFTGENTYSTGTGERLNVELADGSSIILGEESEFTVPRTFNWFNRNVDLKGEAFFEVSKNPDMAFTIKTANSTGQVLGTAFHYNTKGNENSLRVNEGKVAFWSHVHSDTLILTAGEAGVIDKLGIHEKKVDLTRYNSWLSGNFDFENARITEVLETLQNHYVFNIPQLKEFDDLECRFSGSFKEQGLEDILKELSLTMGMEYQLERNTLTIQKFYCD